MLMAMTTLRNVLSELVRISPRRDYKPEFNTRYDVPPGIAPAPVPLA
jgi:hypothetical protein